MTSARPGRAVRAIATIAVLVGLVITALPAATAMAQDETLSFEKLDKPFGSLGLVPVADTTAMIDGSGVPFSGSIEGLDGADITLSAVGEVRLSKKQAKQAKTAWNKAKQKAGAGGSLKAGRHLAAVIETAAAPSGDVVFYALLDGAKANDAVPGFALDPRSGNQLAALFGILGGNTVAGDTQVAGQALAGALEFYNVANETTAWRKGDRWYVLRPLPKGAAVADVLSQLTIGNQQVFDFAAAAPFTLTGEPIPGLRCFNAIGTPMASFEDGPSAGNIVQLNLVVDPAADNDLDPAGVGLVDVDRSGEPVTGEVMSFDALGSTLVSFVGVPSGRHRLVATTPGAEPIVRLLPGVLQLDGVNRGTLSQGLACNSTIEGLYPAGVDACSFGDPDVLGAALGVDPATIVPYAQATPDGSQICGWGAPNVFAGTTFGVRLADDLELVKESLAACEQTGLPGEFPSFIAVCPGLIQHVQLTPAGVTGADGAGFPSGTAFVLGQDAAVDAYLSDIADALDAGDVDTAAGLLFPLLNGDALGYEGFAAAQEGFLGQ